ncbi:hypothetical protein BGZ76_005259 [Entomortierella beljakovae]|nr:hypothetical protein BGZ76_005259 [Entomortierella beljakovae]
MGNPISKFCSQDTTVYEEIANSGPANVSTSDVTNSATDANSPVIARVPTNTANKSTSNTLQDILGDKGSIQQAIKDLKLESKLEKRELQTLQRHEILTSEIKELSIGVDGGGMGIIHMAKWKGRKVAIKEADIKVILREIDVYTRMKGSNYVVEFYGVTFLPFLTVPTLCLVTNYADKGSLTWHLKVEYHKLNWSDKLRLATQISAGIQRLHQVGVYHRDLHGGNIIIDNTGNAMLTDFGASTAMQDRVERNMREYFIEQEDVQEARESTSAAPKYVSKIINPEGQASDKLKKVGSDKKDESGKYDPLIGIMAYIAPERFRNPAQFDEKCDIYSLGVLLWELTSGHPAFAKVPQDVQLAIAIMNGKRELPVEGTPLAYKELYEKCWDSDPAKRPSIDVIVLALKSIRASMTKAQLKVTRKRTKTRYSSRK